MKISGLLPFSFLAPNLAKNLGIRAPQTKKNVIIIVFDAWSAYNVSLYGYARDTTPTINKLAERAVVYHNHYAASNYTTPGTASILTGTLPWTHRAMQPNTTVSSEYLDRSIFSVFNDYHRMSYSHNEWVNTLFDGFRSNIDEWIPRLDLCLFSSYKVIQDIFKNDRDISSVAWERYAEFKKDDFSYSLFLSRLLSYFEGKEVERYYDQFPRGLPTSYTDNGFLLEHAVDQLVSRLGELTKPMLGYFHFLPPHEPYRPPVEFSGRFFRDAYQNILKPADIFMEPGGDFDIRKQRAIYDEYILYVDREFGRLYRELESSGILEDTWLVLTSDHGEGFERGYIGHQVNAIYEPLIRVPLMIFEPGRQSRLDVYEKTSAIDLLSTLAHVTGKDVPEWSEGEVLPPYRQQSELPERGIYSMRSYETEKDSPVKSASIGFVKGRYKLHYYFGYSILNSQKLIKLYDIESDPEELSNIVDMEPEIARQMVEQVEYSIEQVNKRYL
ncbi:MAG: sulfatase-like hydrolase/transferase [Chloroflexi bacterium]|nr:sulfatase-like hydrolase/transferase [Chloroflexota bacterium]